MLYNLIPNYNYDDNKYYEIALGYNRTTKLLYITVNGLIIHSIKMISENVEKHNEIYVLDVEFLMDS